MSECGSAAFHFGSPEARQRGIDAGELREALGLVQESMIKLLRFQLAMERRDRRVALETMDDVVLLERRLDAIVARIPADEALVASGEDALKAQRAKLAQEKFTLAAGAAGVGATRGPEWEADGAARVAVAADQAAPDPAEPAFVAPRDYVAAMPAAETAPRRRLVLAGGLVAACGLAAVGMAASHGAIAALIGGLFG